MSTHIDPTDVARMRRFLAEFLDEEFPELNFTPGSALRDTSVDANAHIAAFLQEEATDVRRATSLNLVDQLEDEENIDENVENILSNWYITRNEGEPVRGTVLVHFSRVHSGEVPPDAVFSRGNLRFIHDSENALLYDSAQLDPVTNVEGQIEFYTLRVPVVAEAAGTEYEIEPGLFDNWSEFSDYILRVENDQQFFGGQDRETTEELLERTQTAISSRDFTSSRSIDALLRERFSFIQDIITKGMGDDGMERDRIEVDSEFFGVHIGGKTDVYVTTPIVERKQVRRPVGEEFTDAESGAFVFDDDNVDDWRVHVDRGDVLRVWNRNINEPDKYLITDVQRDFIRVDDGKPFPEKRPELTRGGDDVLAVANTTTTVSVSSTQVSDRDVGRYAEIIDAPDTADEGRFIEITAVDESTNKITLGDSLGQTGSITFKILTDIVVYSIGDIAPDFDNKVSQTNTGKFTDIMSYSGIIKLPEEPVYLIREVSLIPDQPHPQQDPATGRVPFPNRQNGGPRPEGGSLSYRVFSLDDQKVPSNRQNLLLQVGQDAIQREDRARFVSTDTFKIDSDLSPDKKFDDPADLGKHIIVEDAFNEDNRGEFEIIEVVDPETVRLEKIFDAGWTGVPERKIQWQLSEQHEFDGDVVRVVYDGVQGFDILSSYVEDPERRVLPSNKLLKAPHGIYLNFELYFGFNDTTNVPSIADMKRELVRYINQFPADRTLHTSEIVSFIQSDSEFEDAIDFVRLPLEVSYRLFAPSGDVIHFETSDAVEMTEDKLTSDTTIGELERQTVRDDTVRYIATPELITLTEVEES